MSVGKVADHVRYESFWIDEARFHDARFPRALSCDNCGNLFVKTSGGEPYSYGSATLFFALEDAEVFELEQPQRRKTSFCYTSRDAYTIKSDHAIGD